VWYADDERAPNSTRSTSRVSSLSLLAARPSTRIPRRCFSAVPIDARRRRRRAHLFLPPPPFPLPSLHRCVAGLGPGSEIVVCLKRATRAARDPTSDRTCVFAAHTRHKAEGRCGSHDDEDPDNRCLPAIHVSHRLRAGLPPLVHFSLKWRTCLFLP
jgi:hypothetical protein